MFFNVPFRKIVHKKRRTRNGMIESLPLGVSFFGYFGKSIPNLGE